MSKFQELLAAIDTEAAEQSELAKSIPAVTPADDKAVAAAAGDEGAGDAAITDADKAKTQAEQDLAKSLNPEDNVQVIEVDELIKSMGDLNQRFDENEGLMAKALGDTLNLVKNQGEMIKSQNELIKSLTNRVDALGSQGAGRKALLVATERAQPGEHLAKSLPQPEAAKPQEILAKCLSAQKDGKLTGAEVARAESQLNHGLAVDPAILARIS
jgi:hypothetical protein